MYDSLFLEKLVHSDRGHIHPLQTYFAVSESVISCTISCVSDTTEKTFNLWSYKPCVWVHTEHFHLTVLSLFFIFPPLNPLTFPVVHYSPISSTFSSCHSFILLIPLFTISVTHALLALPSGSHPLSLQLKSVTTDCFLPAPFSLLLCVLCTPCLFLLPQLETREGAGLIGGGVQSAAGPGSGVSQRGETPSLCREREEQRKLLADTRSTAMDLRCRLEHNERGWLRERAELLERFDMERKEWESQLKDMQRKIEEVRCTDFVWMRICLSF